MYTNMLAVYNKVKEVYANTDELSRNIHGFCYYGTDINGIGCAIGCLMGDEPYELIEGLDIESVLTDRPEIYNRYFTPEMLEDLRYLQYTHDTAKDYADFMQELQVLIERQL